MKANITSILFVLAMMANLTSGQLQDLPKCGVRTNQHYTQANNFIVSIADSHLCS